MRRPFTMKEKGVESEREGGVWKGGLRLGRGLKKEGGRGGGEKRRQGQKDFLIRQ